MRMLTAIGVRCAVLAAVLAVITTQLAKPALAASGLDTAAGVTSMPFSIHGSTVMTLTGTGLGIGIAAPNVPLDLGSGVSEKVALYDNGAGNRYGFGVSGGELDVFGGTSGNINFKTNGYAGTSLLYLATGGFVGIGTTSPGSTLDVNGNVNVRSNLAVAGTATVQGQTINGNTVLTANNLYNNATCSATEALTYMGNGTFQCVTIANLAGIGPTVMPNCSGQALTWNGSAFSCVGTGTPPTCTAGQALTWNGSAYSCVSTGSLYAPTAAQITPGTICNGHYCETNSLTATSWMQTGTAICQLSGYSAFTGAFGQALSGGAQLYYWNGNYPSGSWAAGSGGGCTSSCDYFTYVVCIK